MRRSVHADGFAGRGRGRDSGGRSRGRRGRQFRCGVGVSTGGNITTSVGVGGASVGIGVGSGCWQADNAPAMKSDATSNAIVKGMAWRLRGITESRIRIRKPLSFAIQ